MKGFLSLSQVLHGHGARRVLQGRPSFAAADYTFCVLGLPGLVGREPVHVLVWRDAFASPARLLSDGVEFRAASIGLAEPRVSGVHLRLRLHPHEHGLVDGAGLGSLFHHALEQRAVGGSVGLCGDIGLCALSVPEVRVALRGQRADILCK